MIYPARTRSLFPMCTQAFLACAALSVRERQTGTNRQAAACNQDVLPKGLSDNRHGEIGDNTADDVFQPSQRQIVITPFVPQQGKRNLRCDHRNGTAT